MSQDPTPPGQRPALPEDPAWIQHREKFSQVYDDANYSSSLQSFMMRASHRLTESVIPADAVYPRVLEIGAGTGEHFPHVRHRYDEYVLSDLDPEALEFAQRKIVTPQPEKLRFEALPGGDLPYPDSRFDRLIATHVLEHIYQPHLVLREWSRVVKQGGVLSILIPTDPGMAWRLGRHFGPRRNAVRQGLAYDYVMAREHVNPCNNLIALLRHQFPRRTERWWPTPIPAIDLNLFFLYTAINDKD